MGYRRTRSPARRLSNWPWIGEANSRAVRSSLSTNWPPVGLFTPLHIHPVTRRRGVRILAALAESRDESPGAALVWQWEAVARARSRTSALSPRWNGREFP